LAFVAKTLLVFGKVFDGVVSLGNENLVPPVPMNLNPPTEDTVSPEEIKKVSVPFKNNDCACPMKGNINNWNIRIDIE
jgi:hypothetical protein